MTTGHADALGEVVKDGLRGLDQAIVHHLVCSEVDHADSRKFLSIFSETLQSVRTMPSEIDKSRTISQSNA